MSAIRRHNNKYSHATRALGIVLCIFAVLILFFGAPHIAQAKNSAVASEDGETQEYIAPTIKQSWWENAINKTVKWFNYATDSLVQTGKEIAAKVGLLKAQPTIATSNKASFQPNDEDNADTDSLSNVAVAPEDDTSGGELSEEWLTDLVQKQGGEDYDSFEAPLSSSLLNDLFGDPTTSSPTIYEGLSENEVRSLVDYMIRKALDNSDVIEETYKFPVIFDKGITVRGALDASGAKITGFATGADAEKLTKDILALVEKMPVKNTETTITEEVTKNITEVVEKTVVSFTGGSVEDLTTTGPLTSNSIATFNGVTQFNSTLTLGNASSDVVTYQAGSLVFENATNVDLKANAVAALSFEDSLLTLDTKNSRIGIATTTPSTTLDVDGSMTVRGNSTWGSDSSSLLTVNASSTFLNNVQIGDASTDIITLGAGTIHAQNALSFGLASSTAQALKIHSGLLELNTQGDGFIGINVDTISTSTNRYLQVGGSIYASDTVVLGTALEFDDKGTIRADDPTGNAFTFLRGNTQSTGDSFITFATGTSSLSQDLYAWNYETHDGVHTTSTFVSYVEDVPGAAAHVFKTANTLSTTSTIDRALFAIQNGTSTQFLVSPDGNVHAGGTFVANSTSYGIQDLAEYVNLDPTQDIVAGDVVQPHPEKEGVFRKVEEPYAQSAAGVISNTAAFVMGASGEYRGALGLAGIVYVHVTNESGPIAVGDRLVTASTAGALMRYDNTDSRAANAMIVGTALDKWESDEQGKIKMFIRSFAAPQAGSHLTLIENGDDLEETLTQLDVHGSQLVNVSGIFGTGEQWHVDEYGNLRVRQITAESIKIIAPDSGKSTLGRASIQEGDGFVVVEHPKASASAAIFVSFTSNLNGRTYYISDIEEGKSFTVRLTYLADETLDFWYWIVDSDQMTDMGTKENDQDPMQSSNSEELEEITQDEDVEDETDKDKTEAPQDSNQTESAQEEVQNTEESVSDEQAGVMQDIVMPENFQDILQGVIDVIEEDNANVADVKEGVEPEVVTEEGVESIESVPAVDIEVDTSAQ